MTMAKTSKPTASNARDDEFGNQAAPSVAFCGTAMPSPIQVTRPHGCRGYLLVPAGYAIGPTVPWHDQAVRLIAPLVRRSSSPLPACGVLSTGKTQRNAGGHASPYSQIEELIQPSVRQPLWQREHPGTPECLNVLPNLHRYKFDVMVRIVCNGMAR